MHRSTKSTFTAKVNGFFLYCFLNLIYRPRTRRSNVQEETPITHFSDASSSGPPPDSTLPTNVTQSCYDLAQQLRQSLPPTCNWLLPGDVQVIDTTPFSSGDFAEVRKGSVQGLIVAIKSPRCYWSPKIDPAEVGNRFIREVWASIQLSHRNIVPFFGVYSTPSHPFSLLYKMMDNPDLGQYLVEHPNASRLKLLTEISRALKHMHDLGFTHGNIKMRNILVDDDGVACLGGLGSALVPSLAFLVPSFPADWPDVASEKWFPGTAPELVDPGAFGLTQAHTTKTTDIFAFGMLAWEIFAGKPPFSENIGAAVISLVFKNDRPLRPDHREVSDRVWDMIQGCWDRDPSQRMTIADVSSILEVEAHGGVHARPGLNQGFFSQGGNRLRL